MKQAKARSAPFSQDLFRQHPFHLLSIAKNTSTTICYVLGFEAKFQIDLKHTIDIDFYCLRTSYIYIVISNKIRTIYKIVQGRSNYCQGRSTFRHTLVKAHSQYTCEDQIPQIKMYNIKHQENKDQEEGEQICIRGDSTGVKSGRRIKREENYKRTTEDSGGYKTGGYGRYKGRVDRNNDTRTLQSSKWGRMLQQNRESSGSDYTQNEEHRVEADASSRDGSSIGDGSSCKIEDNTEGTRHRKRRISNGCAHRQQKQGNCYILRTEVGDYGRRLNKNNDNNRV